MTENHQSFVQKREYGITQDGQKVQEFILQNEHHVKIQFITYGGSITAIYTPDGHGNVDNIVLGFSNLKDYEKAITGRPYLGALIGRYANRIANGKFQLNNQEYTLPLNEEHTCLHGGMVGFDKKVWQAEIISDTAQKAAVKLSLKSLDGDQGFPGNLNVEVIYSLNSNNEFTIQYDAVSDKDTIVNLTNHSYFNLLGEGKGTVENHHLKLNCSHYIPINHYAIPTGEIASVTNTPMDFLQSMRIGNHLRDDFEQLNYVRGYDHCWVIDGQQGQLRPAAYLEEMQTGRGLSIFTTLPGMQVYTGNGLDGYRIGHSGKAYRQGDGIAFEPQYYPDSPNHVNFPSATLKAGETFQATTIYRFFVKN